MEDQGIPRYFFWSVREVESGDEVYVGRSLTTCASLLEGCRISAGGKTMTEASKRSLSIRDKVWERIKQNNADNLSLQQLWDRKQEGSV